MSNVTADKLEVAIRQLPRVHAARVLLSEDNAVDKVHIMADPETSPKKIIRDIETLLMLKFGLKVDYRRISLVKARPEDIKPFTRPRLRLMAVERREEADVRRVVVSLELGDQTHLGAAEGPPDAEMLTLAAKATIDALQPLITETTLEFYMAHSVPLEEETVILVACKANYDRGTEKLLGSSFLQTDEVTAAARATLHAVNRSFFNI